MVVPDWMVADAAIGRERVEVMPDSRADVNAGAGKAVRWPR